MDLPDGPPANGGMGMMTSFGEGIKLTPLQLARRSRPSRMAVRCIGCNIRATQAEVEKFVPRSETPSANPGSDP